ncbi:MAG: GNAT family N-acetyltransferase [Candidatus Izemoplasmatales bacterium]
MIKYQKAESMHLHQATNFAFIQNAIKENHSSYLSGSMDYLSKDFTESIKNGSLYLAVEDETIIGLLDTFYLAHLNRYDTSLLVDSNADFNKVASSLFRLSRSHAHPKATYSFFFSTYNQRLSHFLLSENAKKQVGEYGLQCVVEKTEGYEDYLIIEKEDIASFTALFNEIFPDIYKTPETIINHLGQSAEVLLYKENQEILGFCVLDLHPSSEVIEMLGVKESMRGKGIGRRLLRQVKRYIKDQNLPLLLKLIVDTDNQNALKLYFDEGFVVEFLNVHFLYEDGLQRGTFSPITIDDVREISSWKYEGYLRDIIMTPYFDNYAQNKPLRGFENASAYSFFWNGELFALLELYQRVGGIELGIALAPKFTGLSLSYDYLDQVISFIKEIRRSDDNYVYVRADLGHTQANHLYQKYGFVEVSKDEDAILYQLKIIA